jgi:hypothetical protein
MVLRFTIFRRERLYRARQFSGGTELMNPLTIVLLVVGLVSATPSWAATRDGQTPAKETVCDSVKSATPGLYGLCVSYCEARDLDGLSGDELLHKAAQKQKALDRYNARRADTDPGMPCVAQNNACPCWGPTANSAVNWLTRSAAPQCVVMDQPGMSHQRRTAGSHVEQDFTDSGALRAGTDEVTNVCWHDDEMTGTSTLQKVSDVDAIACGIEIQTTCNQL